jgi:hypothetical protein
MRRPIIAYMDNGLPVQLLSRRDFLFPDTDEKYVPAVLAYIHDTDVETLNSLLRTRTREDARRTTRPALSMRNSRPRLGQSPAPGANPAAGRARGLEFGWLSDRP